MRKSSTLSFYCLLLGLGAFVPFIAVEPESTSQPIKLQSVASTNSTNAARPVPPPVPVYILPRVPVVFTPQGRFFIIDKHHFDELAALGFQTFIITNIQIFAK